jgi:transcriptional regulator with XRE-family HTH domain
MEKDYQIQNDLTLTLELLRLKEQELAKALSLTPRTLSRWRSGSVYPSLPALDNFYSFLYRRGVRLLKSKAQFYQEDLQGEKLLFHGSKKGIDGPLSLSYSQEGKDFGPGFYCGESLEQSASFVSLYPHSSLYLVAFKEEGLRVASFGVDQEWMLAVAYYRGELEAKKDSPILQSIIQKVETADILYAPIADNRMFAIIGEFVDGRLSDIQTLHALSATSLGQQVVFRSEKALAKVRLLEHCFLSSVEKQDDLLLRTSLALEGQQKATIARIKYQGQGRYIEEILP